MSGSTGYDTEEEEEEVIGSWRGAVVRVRPVCSRSESNPRGSFLSVPWEQGGVCVVWEGFKRPCLLYCGRVGVGFSLSLSL